MKKFIKRHFPGLVKVIKDKTPNDVIFNDIYRSNSWESDESVSGPGSTLLSTENLRLKLETFFKNYGISSIVDAPCGDYNWFKEIDYKFEFYRGYDIVKDIIDNNNKKYASPNVEFDFSDITKDILPKADLIFCRDCLVHLSFNKIFKAVTNFKKSGSKYLLTTSYFDHNENKDIVTGDWRKLNLLLPPFNFPKERLSISEECKGSDTNFLYSKDKCLSLWELDDLVL